MKVVFENRSRTKVIKGTLKTVFEVTRRVKLSGTPGQSGGDVSFRILENDDFRITESGDFRITE